MNSQPSSRLASLVQVHSPDSSVQVVGGDSINFDSQPQPIEVAMKMAHEYLKSGSRDLTEKEEYEIAALSPAVTLTNQKVRREVYGSWLALYHPKFAGKQKPRHLYDPDNRPTWWEDDIPYASANNNKKDGAKRLSKDQLERILPLIRERLVEELLSRFDNLERERQADIISSTLPTNIYNRIQTLASPSSHEPNSRPSSRLGHTTAYHRSPRPITAPSPVPVTVTQVSSPTSGIQEGGHVMTQNHHQMAPPSMSSAQFVFQEQTMQYSTPMLETVPEAGQFMTIGVESAGSYIVDNSPAQTSQKETNTPATTFMTYNTIDYFGESTSPFTQDNIRSVPTTNFQQVSNNQPVSTGSPFIGNEMESDDRPTTVMDLESKDTPSTSPNFLPLDQIQQYLAQMNTNEQDITNPTPLTPDTPIFADDTTQAPLTTNNPIYQASDPSTHTQPSFDFNHTATDTQYPMMLSLGDQLVVNDNRWSGQIMQQAQGNGQSYANVGLELDKEEGMQAMEVDFYDYAFN